MASGAAHSCVETTAVSKTGRLPTFSAVLINPPLQSRSINSCWTTTSRQQHLPSRCCTMPPPSHSGTTEARLGMRREALITSLSNPWAIKRACIPAPPGHTNKELHSAHRLQLLLTLLPKRCFPSPCFQPTFSHRKQMSKQNTTA